MRQSIALASLNEGVTPSRLGMSMTISEAAATLVDLAGNRNLRPRYRLLARTANSAEGGRSRTYKSKDLLTSLLTNGGRLSANSLHRFAQFWNEHPLVEEETGKWMSDAPAQERFSTK